MCRNMCLCFLCFFFCRFVSSYSSLFVYFVSLLFLVPVCVLARERKGVDLGGTGTGEDPRGAGGGETIARYTLFLKNLFSIKKKKKKILGMVAQACNSSIWETEIDPEGLP